MTVEEEIREVVRTELRAGLAELRHLLEQRPAGDRYLSVANAAAHAEVHPDTIRAWLKAGQLPTHHAGRELRVKLSELEAFMAGSRTNGERPSVEEEAAQALARVHR
jgi:excisionase family DNA binding protein